MTRRLLAFEEGSIFDGDKRNTVQIGAEDWECRQDRRCAATEQTTDSATIQAIRVAEAARADRDSSQQLALFE